MNLDQPPYTVRIYILYWTLRNGDLRIQNGDEW